MSITTLPGLTPGTTWHNWSLSQEAHPVYTARPTSVDEIVAIVRFARENSLTVKTVGAGHSFTAIAAGDGIMLDLGGLEGLRAHDPATGRVSLGAGTNLHQLPAILRPLGLALANMGDIDRQTIAGATSTGTHGTGHAFGGLATQVVGVTLVTADGSVMRIDETTNSELLPAARLGLGALGILVELTIQCVPVFMMHAVERPEGFDEVLDDFEARATSVDHFELYWFPHSDGVATKTNTRLPADAEPHPVSAFGEWWEDRFISNHVLSLLCNVGRAVPALTPPINRLATKVYGNRTFTDDSHDVFVSPRNVRFREMEYSIPRAAVPEAVRAVRKMIDDKGFRISFPVEVRVAQADTNWLSTAEGRDAGYIAVHRYYKEDYEPYFRAVEDIMLGFDGRPHWGKLHYRDAASLAATYSHYGDFVAARDRLDPTRLFTNPYLDRVLGK
ncbi:MAG: FAD-linked oxidoreductase [Microbacteriaceae bacterium]|nr:FAD-linked oxidoreductase [Microbacteriaceae bacterium]